MTDRTLKERKKKKQNEKKEENGNTCEQVEHLLLRCQTVEGQKKDWVFDKMKDCRGEAFERENEDVAVKQVGKDMCREALKCKNERKIA